MYDPKTQLQGAYFPFYVFADTGLAACFSSGQVSIHMNHTDEKNDRNYDHHVLELRLSQVLSADYCQSSQMTQKITNGIFQFQPCDCVPSKKDRVRMLCDAICQNVQQHCDQNQFTDYQHKVIYLTSNFFSLIVQNKHQNIDNLVQWLETAELFFAEDQKAYELPYISKNTNHQFCLSIIQMLEQRKFIDLLKIINELKYKINLEKEENQDKQLLAKLKFLQELLTKKCLYEELQLDKSRKKIKTSQDHWLKSQAKVTFPIGSQMPEFHDKSQKTKYKIRSKKMAHNFDNLGQVVHDCICLLLGNFQSLKGYKNTIVFKLIRLYLLFSETSLSSTFNIKEIIQKLQKMGLSNFSQYSRNITDKYLLSLIKNDNYHDTYQQSLSLMRPYYAYALGSIAFLANIPDNNILRYDQNYRINILSSLLESCSHGLDLQSAKFYLNTVCFYEKYFNPLNIYNIYRNDDEDQFQRYLKLSELGFQDPLYDLKNCLSLKFFNENSQLIKISKQLQGLQTEVVSQNLLLALKVEEVKQLMMHCQKKNIVYFLKSYFYRVINFFLIKPLSENLIELMILELSMFSNAKIAKIKEQRKEDSKEGYPSKFYENYFDRFGIDSDYPSYYDPHLAYQYGYYYFSTTIQTLEADYLNNKMLQNKFDYRILPKLRQIQESGVYNEMMIEDEEARKIFVSFFHIYFMLEDAALYFEEYQQTNQYEMDIQGNKKKKNMKSIALHQKKKDQLTKFLNVIKTLFQATQYSLKTSTVQCDGYAQILRNGISFVKKLKSYFQQDENIMNNSEDFQIFDQANIMQQLKIKEEIKNGSLALMDLYREYIQEIQYLQLICSPLKDELKQLIY